MTVTLADGASLTSHPHPGRLLDTAVFLLVRLPSWQIREDKDRGVFVDKARSVFVSSAEEMMDVVMTGSENRRQAATGMNADSSRSHSVLMVTVTQRDPVT